MSNFVFQNIHVGISRKGNGNDMNGKTIGTIAGAAVAASVAFTASMQLQKNDMSAKVESVEQAKAVAKVTTTAIGIESAYAVGAIPDWPIMIFISEDKDNEGSSNRLGLHVNKGITRILSYNNISAPPSDCTLTLFTCADNGSGWNAAYPMAAEKQAATNALLSSTAVPVKAMTNLPDGCLVSLGWLCYVPNGFWSTHTEPVDFDDLSSLIGGWLYRELPQ